jgi:hypothetical protein
MPATAAAAKSQLDAAHAPDVLSGVFFKSGVNFYLAAGWSGSSPSVTFELWKKEDDNAC